DSTSYWRPVFCINNLQRTPTGPGYPACGMFQVKPNYLTGCDAKYAQTPHDSMNVALADGSVRSLGRNMSPATWAAVCDPRDGAAAGARRAAAPPAPDGDSPRGPQPRAVPPLRLPRPRRGLLRAPGPAQGLRRGRHGPLRRRPAVPRRPDPPPPHGRPPP